MLSTRWSWSRRTATVVLVALALVACGGADPTVGVWEVGPGDELRPSTTSFDALVSNVECNSGREAIIEDVEVRTSKSEVVVTVKVRGYGGDQDCQGSPPTLHRIELTEPLGQRTMIDGGCVEGQRAHGTGACPDGAIRYKPQPSG
jgi:hypothetical protein